MSRRQAIYSPKTVLPDVALVTAKGQTPAKKRRPIGRLIGSANRLELPGCLHTPNLTASLITAVRTRREGDVKGTSSESLIANVASVKH